MTGLKFFLGFHRALGPKQNEAIDPVSLNISVCSSAKEFSRPRPTTKVMALDLDYRTRDCIFFI